MRSFDHARNGDNVFLSLLVVVEGSHVADYELPRILVPDRLRAALVDGQSAARAMDDGDANAGVVTAHDIGYLRRDRGNVRRPQVRFVRKPVLTDRIVHAARDDV